MESLLKPILIFGCGNTLFGDDGFGPLAVDYLNSHYTLPEFVAAVDAGTGIQGVLFDIALTTPKPQCIFILDAVLLPDHQPGELFELDLDHLPELNATEFSLHQFPSVNLLRELQTEAGVQVRVLAVQAKTIPECVLPGLSPEIEQAIEPACNWLLEQASRAFSELEAAKQKL